MYLDQGQVRTYGRDVAASSAHVLGRGATGDEPSSVWVNRDNAVNHPVMQPVYFAIENSQGRPVTASVRNDERLFVVVRADVRQLDPALCIGFELFNQDSQLLLSSLATDASERRWPALRCGLVELRCALPRRLLNEGTYRAELHCSLHCRERLARPGRNSPAVHFEIRGGLSDSPYWLAARPGTLAPEWRWTLEASYPVHRPSIPLAGSVAWTSAERGNRRPRARDATAQCACRPPEFGDDATDLPPSSSLARRDDRSLGFERERAASPGAPTRHRVGVESGLAHQNAARLSPGTARPVSISARQAQRCEAVYNRLTGPFEERIVEVDHSRCARGVSLFKCVQRRPGLTETEPSECEIDR